MNAADTPAPSTSNDLRERAQQLYDEHRKQAWEDIQSSTDSFDRSLLTLSSAALGVSLAFVKDVVPVSQVVWLPLLCFSWIALAIAISATVISFRFSISAQNQHLDYVYKYYIEGMQEYKEKRSRYCSAISACTAVALTFFLAGLVGTVIFASINIQRSYSMTERDKGSSSLGSLTEGRQPTNVTSTPDRFERGRQPMNTTPVVVPQPAGSPTPQNPIPEKK